MAKNTGKGGADYQGNANQYAYARWTVCHCYDDPYSMTWHHGSSDVSLNVRFLFTSQTTTTSRTALRLRLRLIFSLMFYLGSVRSTGVGASLVNFGGQDICARKLRMKK